MRAFAAWINPRQPEAFLFGIAFGRSEPCRLCVSLAAVEKALEDESGGYLIDDGTMLPAGVAGFVENLVRFAGREALVPQVDGQAGQFGEAGGKRLGLGRLKTGVTCQMKRIADHNCGDIEATGKPGQRAQILARIAAPLQGEHGLGGEPQFVGDGDADAAVADIETEKTGLGGGFQGFTPISAYIPWGTACASNGTG